MGGSGGRGGEEAAEGEATGSGEGFSMAAFSIYTPTHKKTKMPLAGHKIYKWWHEAI